MTTAMVLLATALVAWPAQGSAVRRRARRMAPDRPREPPPVDDPRATPRRRWALAVATGLAVYLLVGGSTGLVAGVLVLVGGERLLRGAVGDEVAAARAALTREIPGACDLLGVCLAAGMPIGSALAAVAEAVPPPLAGHLRTVAAHYRLGADGWSAWSAAPAELAGLGRVMVRAGESGSAAVPALRVLAGEARADGRAAADAAVRRAGVWVLAPLGACFLPAFLCLGVVPLVLGIAQDVFG